MSAADEDEFSHVSAERRHVLVLLNRWREVCGDRALPGRREIDADSMGDIWPKCFVLAVPTSGDEPSFSYFGSTLAEWFEHDFTGQPRSAVPGGGVLDHATQYFAEVLEEGVPVSHVGDLVGADHQRRLYRSIMLPLGYVAADGDREVVDGILGIVTYRFE